MSWGKRALTPAALRENTSTAGIARLVFAGGKKSSATPWICRRCQSQLAAPRSSTSLTRRTVNVDKKPALRLLGQPFRRHVSDQAKSKDETHSENGTQDELPSHEEQRRSQITRRFNSVMDNLQANIFFAGQRLNDLTGYSGIEKLKREIDEQERALKAAQEQFTQAKHEYTSAIQQRSDSQREVNELLQRKNSWSPTDLERFTSLYRNDHANEQAEQEAQQKLNAAEKASEEAGSKLSAKILRRYHEEQIWSDKIRRMSTWGTWGLMGVNVLLFLVFQIGVEPWRRKRLVRGFEEKVIEALETQNQHSNKVTGEALAALQATHAATVADGMVASTDAQTQTENAVEAVVAEQLAAETGIDAEELKESTEPVAGVVSWMPDLDFYITKVEEAFSTRDVTVRQVDLTKRLLEGLFTGVMLTSIVATIIRGR